MAKGRQQYFADETSIQKEAREFAIEEQLKEKIDSVEEGAQVNVIETVKVNGEALTPDADKAVDVDVPLVEDNLYSVDTEAALSARQGKVLYEYIQNIQSRGRYLSNWNCATGLPTTNPSESPYEYRSGDYFLVSNVSSGTNYRPDGSQYVIGIASTTVETEIVKVSDMYIYDGTNWQLILNTERPIAIDSSMDITSTNPVENRVITQALSGKENTISDLQTIRAGAAAGATAVQPGDSLSTLSGDSDDIAEGSSHLFMTTTERTKLGNQTGINTGDETQATIMSKLGVASTSTNGYLTSSDWNTFNNKQDAISDLQTIRDNATAGAGAATTIASYGDVVTHDASEFATAAQGALADTALQSGDNVSELVNDAGYITSAYHDSTKQDTLTLGTNLAWGSGGELNATDTTYVASDFDIKDLTDSTGLRTAWSGKQDELIAGTNIQIAADGKTISATDTTYTAGPGISISNNNVISNTQTSAEWGNITGTLSDQTDLQSALAAKQDELTAGENVSIVNICESDMQGPCPSGFHVPTTNEWEGLIDIMENTLSLPYGHYWMSYLHMPLGGFRDCETGDAEQQGGEAFYATSIFYDELYLHSFACFFRLRADSSYEVECGIPVTMGFLVRGFKNEYEEPTSSWTVVQGTLGNAGIFYDETNGLISITNGTTGYTIMDKNLGATTVYNSGNTLSEANCGKYYQWGNNYGFAFTGSITTSLTQVDASGYGPGNYYSSDTFIITVGGTFDWSSVENKNLWGGVSQGTWCRLTISANDTTYTAGSGISINQNNEISNSGVTSVNGQTGDITIQTGGNYSAGSGINIDANNEISNTGVLSVNGSTGAVTVPTYSAGNGINISAQNAISVDTSVVATQTDVSGMVSKGTNDADTELFRITSQNLSPQSTTAFGPDFVRCGFNNGTSLSGMDPTKTGVVDYSSNKTSELMANRLALMDFNNMTQTTYAEDGITVADNGYGTSDTFEFSGGGNNQIARLKDVKTYTASTGINIDSSNNISNTLPGPTIAATAPTGTEGALWYDTANDVLMAHDGTAWKEAGTQMKVLSYGHSTWQDFIDAYNENAVVYCRASSNSNPATGNQTRMAFMAYVNSATPTEVEFQYYRSRSDHNTAANQLDQVFVYKLTSASGGTWTVTERNTAAKAVAGTGISLTFGSGNMTIANTGVTSVNGDTGAVTVPTYSNGTYLTLSNGTFDVDTSLVALKSDLANFAGFEVVAVLPSTNIKTNIIYLLGPLGTGADKYEEYIYSNSNWIMIGETSIDLTNYLNTSTQTSDAITEGSTNLFLTSAERTLLGNTSGTNSGDETKTTIQTKLGAATSSNSGYLTSTDWSAFNGKVKVSTDLNNELTSGASIWVGDDLDLPAIPDSNTVYLCKTQTAGTARLPAAYQEVEYIESGSDGNSEYIQFTLPYNSGELGYDIIIDVSNVGNAEGVLYNITQSMS